MELPTPWCAIYYLGPAPWQLFEFSLSPTPQCKNNHSKSLLQDHCNAGQLRVTKGKTRQLTQQLNKNAQKLARKCVLVEKPLANVGFCAPAQSKTEQKQSMKTLPRTPFLKLGEIGWSFRNFLFSWESLTFISLVSSVLLFCKYDAALAIFPEQGAGEVLGKREQVSVAEAPIMVICDYLQNICTPLLRKSVFLQSLQNSPAKYFDGDKVFFSSHANIPLLCKVTPSCILITVWHS